MKEIFLLSLFVLILVFSPLAAAGELKPDLSVIIAETPEDENISVIILFHERPMISDISTIRSDGAGIKYQYTIINAVAARVPAKAADKIAKRDFVKLVEPDYRVKLVLDKSIQQIKADKVWEAGITGKEIDVAIIDTGIHDEHPSLTVEKEVDYTGEGTDDLHGHGTHVAGTVASTNSTYRGVAYDADLFNVKVLNQHGLGYSSDIIIGIQWAVNNGAEVISMSLGAEISPCYGTDAMSQAVDNAATQGVVVVVAAGNDGPDTGTITSPGCSRKGITVGAVDDDNVSTFSSRGSTGDGRVKPDLVAPGVSITSTWNDNSFNSISGTSMATPHVSGVAALLLEMDSSLTPDDVKNILKSTALDLGLDNNTQGAGRVNAYAAAINVSPTAPVNCSSDAECDDANDCTADACMNPGNISAYCSHLNVADDTSCSGGICCSGSCAAPVCSSDLDCSDGNSCTTDTCSNAGTCSASCSKTPITSCVTGDGCCPPGCNYINDNDCSPWLIIILIFILLIILIIIIYIIKGRS